MNYQDNIGTAFRRARMINLWLPSDHHKVGHICFSEEDITRLPSGQVAIFPTEAFINEDFNDLTETFTHNGVEISQQELLSMLQSFYLTLAEKRDNPPPKDFTPSLNIIIP